MRSFAADGTVFFLVVLILASLFQVSTQSGYYFGVQPSFGVGLLAIVLFNALAAYASWKSRRWGFVLAFAVNLVYIIGSYASTVFPSGYRPIDALYGSIDITTRIVLLLFALEAYREAPITKGSSMNLTGSGASN